MNDKLDLGVQNGIDKHVAELTLQDNNTQTIVQLEDKLKVLPSSLSGAYGQALSRVSGVISSTLMPFITPKNVQGQTSMMVILKDYPIMLLADSLVKTIFGYSNMKSLTAFIEEKLYGKQEKQEKYGEEQVAIGTLMNGFSITGNVNTETYIYSNLQEIAKVGGNKFMLNRMITYISHKESGYHGDRSFIDATLGMKVNLVQNFIYFAEISMLNEPTQEKMFSIEQDLGLFSRITGLSDQSNLYISIAQNPSWIKEILHALKLNQSHGASRELSDGMSLALDNYHLKKVAPAQEMLHIPHLDFTQEKVYAITGQIGTGKTTLLSDIAKCLMPVFLSEGQIKYPVDAGGDMVVAIFCGTTTFVPPATTLFERLTYRIPEAVVKQHKAELLQDAIDLFQCLGQRSFTKEKLETKGRDKLNLSTGQEKLCIIISSILYKQYLNKPVLFAIDETLANLDRDTEALVCAKIKEVFGDSIVISVDHNSRHNRGFYDEYVDLASYAPDQPVIYEMKVDLSGASAAPAEE